jgi:uncharacterized protein YaaR (DUF327 family)
MKIQDLSGFHNLIRAGTGVERREAAGRTPSFRQELAQLSRAEAERKLVGLQQDIDRQGQVLAHRCDIMEMKKYREMIAEFMYEAVRFAFSFKKQSTMDARGRHRIFALIKRINKKLEELAAQVLADQTDNLAVMNSIDELRGLLLDLYL